MISVNKSSSNFRLSFQSPKPSSEEMPPLKPWGIEDPFLVQARAESEVVAREKDRPEIVKVVRRAIVPVTLSKVITAYQPNDFSECLATDSGSRPKGKKTNLSWSLPAHEFSKDRCGEFMTKKTHGCPQGHEVHTVRYSCHRLSCPVCYPDGLSRGAGRIASTLRVVNDAYAGMNDWYHVVVSPPQEWAEGLAVTTDGYKALKGAVWGVLKRCGVLGAVGVFHPYRQDKDKDTGLALDTWRIGPHFHFIAYGWPDSSRIADSVFQETEDDDSEEDPEERNKWVVKVIRRKKQRSSVVTSDRFHPLAHYMLSHAGVAEGVRSIIHFGICSSASKNSPVKFAEFTEDTPKRCQTCGGNLYGLGNWLDCHNFLGWDCLKPVTDRHVWQFWTLRKYKADVLALLKKQGLVEALALAEDDPGIVVVHDPGTHACDSSEVNDEGVTG